MDESRGARERQGDAAGSSERTSDLLNGRRARDAQDTLRHTGNGRHRPANGHARDPERTEEIEESGPAPRAGGPRPDGSAAGRPSVRVVQEKTQPVGGTGAGTSIRAARTPGRTLPVLVFDDPGTAAAAAPGHRRLPNGTVLSDRYVVVEAVADSAMGLVYRALDRQRERAGAAEPWVALKTARPGGADTAFNLRQEFLKLTALRHPNIVAVYDLGSDRGIDFMVLEWLRGETLAEMLDRITTRRISLYRAREIIRGIAAALAHAHAAGVVHGDVKPSNVIVTREHAVKLLDFGATPQSPPAVEDGSERSWATRAYASCEVLGGLPPLPSDDVFALGVTAYRLLCGRRPFGELDALAAKEQQVSPPPPPEDAAALWPAIRSALEFDAGDRPADGAEFLQRLSADADADESRRAIFPRPVPAHLTAIAWGVVAAIALGWAVWRSMPDTSGAGAEVEAMLDAAAAAEAAGRRISPPDDSAFAGYSAVLEREPENAEAREGLDRIAEHFLTRARGELDDGDFRAAVHSLAQARRVSPGHFGIAAIEDLIGRFRVDLLVRARQASQTDPELAEGYLARAAALSPPGDPDVERAREVLREQRAAREIEALTRAIDERILSERLTVPAGDSAVDLLRRATRLDPDDRQVQLARDRIASALLFQAMFSISNGSLDNAQAYIDAAKSLNVRHLAMARAEYELERARYEALIAPGGSK